VRAQLLLVAAVLVAPLAGCGVFGSDPRQAATAFLAAVAQGNGMLT
jgi:hypothetical protein